MEIVSLLKWLFASITALATAYFIVYYIKYRLPASRTPEVIEGEVFYAYADPDKKSDHRETFEQMLLGNAFIQLSDRSQWYVSKKDYALIWPESPHAMREKGYTLSVALTTRPLRFGGYGPAKVTSTTRLNKPPIIGK